MADKPLSLGFDVPFDEAVAACVSRGVVLPSVYYGELRGIARQLSFSVAGLACLDQLQAVRESLDQAMQEGLSFGEWKQTAGAQGTGLGAGRLDNIFRTNLQGNYMRGKAQQFEENKANRPYLLYDAINDNRTRPTHLAMDGTIRAVDDPWWSQNFPPNGYRCIMPWTPVRGDFEIGLKSWYSGKAVEIKTKSGAVLSVTANHPILSRHGWVAAHRIKQGDNVLHHNIISNASFIGIVDNNNPPARAENVFNSLAFEAFGFVDITSFEFHDDTKLRKGKVYVAGSNGVLMHGFKPLSPESLKQRVFIRGDDRGTQGKGYSRRAYFSIPPIYPVFTQNALDVWSTALFFFHKLNCAFTIGTPLQHPALSFIVNGTSFVPSCLTLAFNSTRGRFDGFPFKLFGFTLCPFGSPSIAQTSCNDTSANAKTIGKFKFAFSKFIKVGNSVLVNFGSWFSGICSHYGIHFSLVSFFDTGISKQPIKQTTADSLAFQHFHDRFSSQVFVDEVVSVRNFSFSGHVYDFQCKNGVIVADEIITHNCRCSVISLTESQAKARSGPDRGLNKKPMVKDPKTGQEYPARPDAGWDYNPFEDRMAGIRKAINDKRSQCGGLFSAVHLAGKKRHNTPIWCQGSGADYLNQIALGLDRAKAMPEPRSGSLFQVLPEGLSEREYLTKFMQEFDSNWNDDAQITTKTGHELLISREMFKDHKTGDSKIKREGRFRYILFIADTVKKPDEIRLESGDYQDETLLLLSRYTIRGKLTHIITAYKKTGALWTGWSGYQSTSETYFQTKREGVLLYRRE